MIDVNLLKVKIEESGYKLKFIAKKLGITYQAFLNKMNGDTEFKLSEIQMLCDVLNISVKERDNIFFNLNVE